MKLQAVRGRNQRGISFVSAAIDLPDGPALLSHEKSSVLTTIKKNERIPAENLIIDKRQFDVLNLDQKTEVLVESIDEELPICTELVLSISSRRSLDADRIIRAFSQKIEDLEPYLDGLILEKGRAIYLEELGVLIKPSMLNPSSEHFNAARVKWRRLLKVYLEAARAAKGFNLCIVVELGAASRKVDVLSSSAKGTPASRLDLAQEFVIGILHDLRDKEILFNSLGYSKGLSIFSKDEPTKLTDAVTLTYDQWLNSCKNDHEGKPSNLALALQSGIEVSSRMHQKNQQPVFMILFSSGGYSHGTNPVPVVRNLLSGTESIFLACVGIGNQLDDTLLEAIANRGKGIKLLINDTSQIAHARNQLINWMESEE